MARAIFSHELGDPDFQWLLTTFTEKIHTSVTVDIPCLPIVLLIVTPEEKITVFTTTSLPLIPSADPLNSEAFEEPSNE